MYHELFNVPCLHSITRVQSYNLNIISIFILVALVGFFLPHIALAVNYQPPSQGFVLGAACPDSSTIQLTLNSTGAKVYSDYIASQKFPARLFLVNYDNKNVATQCSPVGTLTAFSIQSPGILQTDGSSYTIKSFRQLPAPDAVAAAKQAMEDAVKDAKLMRLKNAAAGFNNGDKNPKLEEEYFKSLKIPDGYLDLMNALKNLTQAPVITTGATTSGDLQLVDRGGIPVLVVLVAVALNAILVIGVSLIKISDRQDWSGSSGTSGSTPGRIESVPYPSIYVPPWFIQTGKAGISDDPEPEWPPSPFTITCSQDPGGSPSTEAKPPSSGPCSIYLQNISFQRPNTTWSFAFTGLVTGLFGITGINATLVIECDDKSLKEKKLAGEAKENIFDSAKLNDPSMGLACTAPGLPSLRIMPYLKLDFEQSYSISGGGEIDIDFAIRIPDSTGSLIGVQPFSGLQQSQNEQALATWLLGPGTAIDINRFAASVTGAVASTSFPLSMGFKATYNSKEIVDIGLVAKPQLKFTGTNLEYKVENSSPSSPSSSSISLSEATPSPTLEGSGWNSTDSGKSKGNAGMGLRRASSAGICNADLVFKGGVGTKSVIKWFGQKADEQDVEPFTDVPVNNKTVELCSKPWVSSGRGL